MQKKIEELTAKNNSLVERMKKIAANLKKKTQNCQDLEQQLQSNQEKWEIELNEKNTCIREKEEEIEALRLEVDMYHNDIRKKFNVSDLETQNISQPKPVELRSEISLQEELSGSSIIPDTFSKSDDNSRFSKIRELELIIETQENDIMNYKERISMLEETLAKMEERRETLEQKTNELGVQLLEKSQSFEEISKTEDLLEEKLKNLTKYNEDVEKKLEQISRENERLQVENDNFKDLNERLKQKLNVAQERVNEQLEVIQNATILEQELEKSRSQINDLEIEIRKLEINKVQLEESTRLDLEKFDHDWQIQFEVISKEKSELSVTCEKMSEKIAELAESEQVLLEKVNELNIKLEKSYELQDASDQELMTQNDEIKNLKNILDQKNRENDNNLVQLEKIQTEKQDEMDSLKIINKDLMARVDELVQDLNSIKTSLEQAHTELSQLRNVNTELQTKLQIQSDNQVHEQKQQTQPLFAWSYQQDDPFSFIGDTQDVKNQELEDHLSKIAETESSSVQMEQPYIQSIEVNTKEQLLEKIKTLEFILKNVENERDDVLNQCSHLSNEVMKFVYEKEGDSGTKLS
ncbi:hypothetical protein HHI36_010553 [Cryptolaemus montrouzieri]|uniref:Uncharacterized protein n=1 Tax=Cryptolaemus montrouzieri TaxID=559131 RepID=A0ABD2MJ10_9CUCU